MRRRVVVVIVVAIAVGLGLGAVLLARSCSREGGLSQPVDGGLELGGFEPGGLSGASDEAEDVEEVLPHVGDSTTEDEVSVSDTTSDGVRTGDVGALPELSFPDGVAESDARQAIADALAEQGIAVDPSAMVRRGDVMRTQRAGGFGDVDITRFTYAIGDGDALVLVDVSCESWVGDASRGGGSSESLVSARCEDLRSERHGTQDVAESIGSGIVLDTVSAEVGPIDGKRYAVSVEAKVRDAAGDVPTLTVNGSVLAGRMSDDGSFIVWEGDVEIGSEVVVRWRGKDAACEVDASRQAMELGYYADGEGDAEGFAELVAKAVASRRRVIASRLLQAGIS